MQLLMSMSVFCLTFLSIQMGSHITCLTFRFPQNSMMEPSEYETAGPRDMRLWVYWAVAYRETGRRDYANMRLWGEIRPPPIFLCA